MSRQLPALVEAVILLLAITSVALFVYVLAGGRV